MRRPDRGTPPRVLYVTHTSIVSGAEHALLELLRGLPPHVAVRVLCPEGELADLLRRERFDVGYVPGTTASLRLSPLQTLRGAGDLAMSAIRVRRTARLTHADVVHANSIRAGLIAVFASFCGGPAVIVHVHDVLPEGRVPRLVRRLLRARATALIGISEYSKRKFLATLPPADRPFPVLYNPVDIDRFAPTGESREKARARLGVGTAGPLLGVVAQITPWKGHDTAIEALGRLRHTHSTARLVCVGEAKFVGGRFDNVRFERQLRKLIASLDLEDAVEFWGQLEDVPAVLAALDALLVPSWEEPLGRTMLEAMAAGTPVVATTVGGPPEVIKPGVTGYLAPPHEPQAWAETLAALLEHPQDTASMAAAARGVVASRFGRDAYVGNMLDLYAEVIATRERTAIERR